MMFLVTLSIVKLSHLFDQITKIKFSGLKVVDFMDGADLIKILTLLKICQLVGYRAFLFIR